MVFAVIYDEIFFFEDTKGYLLMFITAKGLSVSLSV